ncbi:gliding motility-associated C-terminal domain-containing protein [Larkinella bovis]|uniref:Gliding motility-associated C-terminal domain-containing protein n=1 Tax=Larkinella bovis TaxID=683041 RepID=A0ABW0IDV2_9BACT
MLNPASVSQSGTYTVVVTSGSGCTAVAMTSVSVGSCQQPCSLSVSVPTPGAVCVGGSVVLTASASGGSGNLSYVWSGANLSSSSGSSVMVQQLSSTSTYTVVVTDSQGCQAMQTVSVGVLPAPVASASSGTACVGGVAQLNLSASGGVSYRWKGPNGYASNGQNPVLSPASVSQSGTYTVVVTSGSGCTAVTTTSVSVGSCEQPTCTLDGSITASNEQICLGSNVTLSAQTTGEQGAMSYQWTGPNLSSTSGSSVTVMNLTATSTFTLVVSDEKGCSITRIKTVVVEPIPVITVLSTANPTSCLTDNDGSITLSGFTANQTYQLRFSRNGGEAEIRSLGTSNNGQIVLNGLPSGTYSITASSGSCPVNPVTATLLVPKVPQKPQLSVSPSVTACLGESVTLTAIGVSGATFHWTGSGLSTLTGSVVTVTPTAAGSQLYTVTQTVNGCTSTEAATVTITGGQCTTCSAEPPVVICTTTDICPGDAVVLYASGCSGTIVWSTNETGESIVVSPTVSTTYTAQCKLPDCTSKPAKPVVINVSDPKPPTITASALEVCTGNTVTLTATGCEGKVIWSTGATGSAISVVPEMTTSYYANCRIHNCISGPSQILTIRTGPMPKPVISSTTGTICPGENATLTISNCSGTPVWSTGATTVSIVVSPNETASYTVSCKQGACVSPVSDVITLSVVKPQAPLVDISADIICLGESVTLTAMNCSGTVTWSNGAVGASVTVFPTTNTTYRASCKVGNCTSALSQPVSVTVVNPEAPIIKADKTMICAGQLVTLTAEGCQSGQIIWSDHSTGKTISVMPGATSNYTAQCKEHNCTSAASNVVTINVTNSSAPTPTVTASATEICHGQAVTLTATGCGSGVVIWSTNATGNSIVVNPTQTTEYYAACRMAEQCNGSPAKVTVRVNTPPKPTIRVCKCTDGHICPGDEIRLTVAGCNGTPLWSNGATETSMVVSPSQTTVYTVVCQSNGCVSAPSEAYTVVVSAPTPPVVWASQPEIEPGETVTLSATGCAGGQIIWSTGATGSSIEVSPTTTTSYYAHCKIKGCLSEPTPVTVMIKGECNAPAPTISASTLVVCYGGTVTLTATGCTKGTISWSNGDTGTSLVLSNITANRPYTAICKVTDACESAPSMPVSVSVITLNPPTIAADKPILCPGETARLTAVGCPGTVTWSNGATGTSLDVQPTVTTDYWATCSLGNCVSEKSPLNTVKIGTPVSPTVTASTTTVCFGESVTLKTEGCQGGYVIWSNNQVGAEITITPAMSATYSAVCCTSDACRSGKSNDIAIKVYPKVKKPLVVNITNSCPFATADLTKALSSSVSQVGSVFEFYTRAIPDPTTKVTNPKSVEAGTYYVVEKTATGCYSLASQILVVIINCNDVVLCTTNPASASAGPDATICTAKSYKLNGVFGGAATSALWTSSGTGTFDNASLMDATYTPSLADVQAGFVNLTFTTNDPDGNGPCKPAQSTMKLTIQGLAIQPTIGAVSTVLCHGDSVVLRALPDGYKYLWNTMATTQSILVRTSGSYFVQLVNEQGCTSVASEAIVITVKNPIESPIAPMMARNTCPASTVDLTKVVENEPFTTGGAFEFHIGENPGSPIVMRPDSVGHGVFYAFERSGAGCYSPPTMIDVSIFDCNTDTCRSDLYVKYAVDKPYPKVGEVVTFNVKLGNNGHCTATHSDIRIILPTGLELVSPGNLIVDAHGHLGAWISVLPENDEVSFYYSAKVLTKGAITNLVEITYLDQVDPVLANNKATVTIEDSTRTMSMMVGVAKALKGVQQKEETLFEFTYDIAVTNYSDQDATQVQVSDDVQSVFDPHVIESVFPKVDDGSTLKLNLGYSGWVGNTQLLTSESVVKAGKTEHILLKVNVRLHPDGSVTKTFFNQAYVLAKLNGETLDDASNNGNKADPDNDGNPNNNSEPTPAQFNSAPPSQLGVALAVAEVIPQADSSYNVTYKIIVKNFGDTDLKQVQLTDSLVAGFDAPVSYSMVSAPVVGAGSTLIPNADFDGKGLSSLLDREGSSLAAGASDTVFVVVNIKPNSGTGPFYTQMIGTAIQAADSVVTDLSNNGINPAPLGSAPTGVRFDLPPSLLGVAKSVSKLEDLGAGVYKVTYTIKLSNLGSDDLKNVQVVDNLTETFGSDVLIGPGKPVLTAESGLAIDTTYTGQGMLTSLLIDSLSTLPKNTSRFINLTVRVDVSKSPKTIYYNRAIASAEALNGSLMLSDTSTAGSNVDPDNDLDPRNNSTPTAVTLLGVPVPSKIGVAMAVSDTARQVDGSYQVTYQIIVKNYGSKDFSGVQLTDKLAEVFNPATGATYQVMGASIASGSSGLVTNSTYDGDADADLLAPGSTLAAGATDTLLLAIKVKPDGRTTPFLNTVLAKAIAGNDTLSDISTDGFEPDLNGNNDPTENDESVATPLSFNQNADQVMIPEGFSPNGDGVNDRFIIRNVGGTTVRLEVFNRWGHTVYRNQDYKNDWDGTTNTGARIGSDSKGLPDGTYFYVVELSDGRKFIRYMTINR